MASSEGVQVTFRSWSSVDIIPPMRRVNGSSWYIQARQNPGMEGTGMVTPQKREKRIMMKGFMREEMNALGVSAAMAWPNVTEKNSSIMMRYCYPAQSASRLKPAGK